ncbi:MAG TPA: lytic transglycosylase domain-containing protein [Flavobacteriales bacterium]|nr:lytic transglycosylase domain-containing protein [Flavobacteriales bacterium]HIN40525.1 lytic transglycosylase domain-containing protein [Flavobacteriales bacterium]
MRNSKQAERLIGYFAKSDKNRKRLISFIGLGLLLVIFRLFSFSSAQLEEKIDFHKQFIDDYGIYALDLPNQIDFCGEKMPMNDLNLEERLDKELLSNTYFQSNTMLYFKKASRWFPVIEPILKENGIPDDFKYLPLVESNLSNVVSPAGATGYWQLMKSTAKQFNLEVNDVVDERYNMVLSTRAACRYLKNSYAEFNNWTLCAAAYNMGIDGIKKQLKRQKATNYYDLYLNSETSRYVFRLLAIKEIMTNPENYGYHFREEHLYPKIKYSTLMVDTPINNIAEFAKTQNVNYRIIKIHNPWLRKNYLTNKTRKNYKILVPDSGYYVIETLEHDSQNTLLSNDSSQIRKNIVITNDTLDSSQAK